MRSARRVSDRGGMEWAWGLAERTEPMLCDQYL